MATPIFNLSENIPVFKVWFMIIVSGVLISGIIFFSKIVEIPSLSQLDFGFNPLTTFSTTVSSTSVKLNVDLCLKFK